MLFWIAFAGLLARHVAESGSGQPLGDTIRTVMSYWMLPALIAGLVLYGWAREVRVYDSLVVGAKQGFDVALRIIPYLVAILVAIGMFRASGGIDLMVAAIGPFTALIGMPAEALPMAILRPLSGSGAFGVMTEIMKTHGPDSLIGYMVSTFQGSTETTFYTLAVYFGAVGIKDTRHALPACLAADLAGIVAAVFIVNLMFG
jgi:spore maturation protein SpmB